MPLKRGRCKKTVSYNIRELYHANKRKSPSKRRSRKQIIAIAYAAARRTRRKRR